MDAKKNIFEIKDLFFEYDDDFELQVQDLKASQGDLIYIAGLNASGKTTFLQLLAGLLRPQRGQIQWNEKNYLSLKPNEKAQILSYISQRSHYYFSCRLIDFILTARYSYGSTIKGYTKEDLQLAEEALSQVGLENKRDQDILKLSGGELRRAELAQVLCQNTPIILLDEPLTFLDKKQTKNFLDILFEMHNNMGYIIFISSHHHSLFLERADHVFLFDKGKIALNHSNLGQPLSEKKFLEYLFG